MKITLTKPPSINHLYGRNGHRTYIKPEGAAWFEEAGYQLNSQSKRRTPLKGELSVYITIYFCGRYDIDNGNKALLDLFTKHQIWEDDSQIYFLQLQKVRVKHKNEQKVEVEIVA